MRRRVMTLLMAIMTALVMWAAQLSQPQAAPLSASLQQQWFGNDTPMAVLEQLEVKGRAPKTGYARKQFGDGWGVMRGCSVREVILARDLEGEVVDEKCRVQSGVLRDPYTGRMIQFRRGPETSAQVQIDHVVALSDAWQKGAQGLSVEERTAFANDPLNLLASDGPANQAKGDADAATWLPPNKLFRCQYVARQIAIKKKYRLWVTEAEKRAMMDVLSGCAAN